MTVLEIFQYVALFLNGFSLGMAIYSLYLSLRQNRRLIEENRVLRLSLNVALNALVQSEEEKDS